ncbi:hypothetical protein BGZ65_011960 [Modicella reniformis]|uniref:STB6-like N-terminal domain-containing protein n=1 Tax=Modicella reniformis TaxID=1440133 RepID=A0A9P6MAM2_9FUNG|nr:hypothetical protein BGZ65_011960 [Modicella reniformis]
MPLATGRFVFCERRRINDICQNVEGIRIDSTETTLEGYQIYLVEQWTIERSREIATAASFTGDPLHKTGYGHLFVTNLSLFASSLNIVLVPHEGDFDLYRRRFYLNLNLRRMGCSGRSALTSKSPSDAQREKFNQLYKISDSPDFEDTVIRLVELVQTCLFIFGLFNFTDVDGLLCNATERGLNEFYETFLSAKFQRFFSDSALDPSVLAGMFSKVANVRGKLQHLMNNVPKDPLAEPIVFINAVQVFQIKKPDLKACFLDLKTVEAINIAYQSSFNPQGLKVHKVLKSKIEDFSGMSAVNNEGETTDLEVFAKTIHIDSLKQVWRGKQKHKPDVADALASGDWLTGGKELGKSLVRGLAKTTRETKNASQSRKSKVGSDDERIEADESDEGQVSTANPPSTVNFQGSEEEAPNTSTADVTSQLSSIPTFPSLDTLALLFTQKPEPPRPPEITPFYLNRRPNQFINATSRKRSQSMTRLEGHERLLGCRTEAAKSTGAIPGIDCDLQRKIVKHPASRKRSQSYSHLQDKNVSVRPLKSRVVECDTQTYYSYQLLKEKEETLKSMYGRMQAMDKEFTAQLESLSAALEKQRKQFEEIDCESEAILREREQLLEQVEAKEHDTQRSVYHLEGMVSKLIEMRGFTDAFFNKISYLDTKLPASQRRLALWMDRLQALQFQWFKAIGQYITIYAPVGFRDRFNNWERNVQQAALKAPERGEVGEIQLGTHTVATAAAAAAATAVAGPGSATTSARSGTTAVDSTATYRLSRQRDQGKQLYKRKASKVGSVHVEENNDADKLIKMFSSIVHN